MHWNTEQVLWALVLAAHFVLLIVLLGRDRASRFPWFTASIAVSTVHLLADHLLSGKLTTIAFYWQSYTIMAIEAILGLLVLVELARRVFSSGKGGRILKGKGWLGGIMVTLAIAIAAIWAWGPWPTWKVLNAQPAQLPLLLVVLFAMKSTLFVGLLTVEVALLMRIFGKRFGFGWKTHAQQIALGLSTYAIGVLVVQGITDSIKHNLHITSREQYDRLVHLFASLDNARLALWVLVLIWWIIWLWRDEPGSHPELATAGAPVLAGPPTLERGAEAEIREADQEGDPDFRD
jgi:hypothetical protein